jgi:hypothetical protein
LEASDDWVEFLDDIDDEFCPFTDFGQECGLVEHECPEGLALPHCVDGRCELSFARDCEQRSLEDCEDDDLCVWVKGYAFDEDLECFGPELRDFGCNWRYNCDQSLPPEPRIVQSSEQCWRPEYYCDPFDTDRTTSADACSRARLCPDLDAGSH